MQASIGTADNPSNLRIYLRPNVTQTPALFSTLQFNVALPASITPIPTLTVVSTGFPTVPAGSWVVEAPYIENGFIHYNILTASAGYNLNISSGVEFIAMEVSFTGGPLGTFANTAHLVTLPDGGTGGSGASNALFLCTGTINSNGQNLYYSRDASVVIANGDSYKNLPPGDPLRPAGTFTSFARLVSGITLPVKFASFFASKQSNDALLNWTVENQNHLVKHFEIERSFNGISFTKIADQNPTPTTNGNASYNLTDAGVFDNYKGTVYYRIKQVDHNGTITYSIIRTLKINSKAFAISLYPNPVVHAANLVFNLEKAQPVTITLIDGVGKTISNYSMQAAKGINQKNIDVKNLAAGTYTFIIKTENDTENMSFVKSN
jgi:hypothetical protein